MNFISNNYKKIVNIFIRPKRIKYDSEALGINFKIAFNNF